MLLRPFVALSLLLTSSKALWPLPKNLSTGTTPLRLSPDFQILLSGVYHPPADLVAAVERTSNYLRTDKLQALVPDRGASSLGAIQHASSLSSLTLSLTPASGEVKSISEEAIADVETRVEGYMLTVPADGSTAVLTANSTLGLFRGLTTFEQLWYELNGYIYTLTAPISITDAPAYVRGIEC